jgi:hypothetical protein
MKLDRLGRGLVWCDLGPAVGNGWDLVERTM